MTRRVLVDECLPIQLHRWLTPLEVRTVDFMGWKSLGDPELLARAAGSFDVLLTNDALLAEQNDLASLGLGVVLLTTNRVREVERLVPAIRKAIAEAGPGRKVLVAST